MAESKKSWVSHKLQLKNSPLQGKGLFAISPIKKDEIVVDFEHGNGQYVSGEKFNEVYSLDFDYGLQVDDDLFFAAMENAEVEDADFINHSCEPTCGIKDKLKIVAIRDIEPGEEITFDYAMSESSDLDMACACGKPSCRKHITGNDWKIPELQQKYKGYFSEYLQKRIDQAK